ncbi:MAG: hypothetical protein JNK74_11870 [Candidatus Hydrogenedentes bacterium]|nr:hypothetical protein [Candidatus Hydrogenedentota bacterium]
MMPRRARLMLAASALVLSSLPSPAGTLSIGRPVVQNNQYTFPVNLQGNAEGVAALDFRLAYDPAVFSPVSAQIGASGATAQKQVSSNVAEPGEFIVVMMGFNQNVVEPGTVVQVVLEKIGEPANGQSELQINEPTMATYEGVEIDSNGQARVVKFGEENQAEEVAEESPAEEPNNDAERPESPTEAEADPGARPAGSFKFIVAEPTENKDKAATSKAAAGSSAGGLAVASESPTGSRGGESTATTELPPGNGPKPSTETGEESMVLAGKTASLSSRRSAAEDEASAALIPSTDGVPAPAATPLEEESGNRGVLFVTLLAAVIALPVAAFLGLKALRKD